MRRVLMAATVPVFIRSFLLPLAEHFRAKGWRVDAMARDATGCERTRAAFDSVWDIGWARSPLAPGNLMGPPRELREVVAREGYDLVHVHTHVAAFVTRFALRSQPDRPKIIYTAHGFSFFPGGPPVRNMVLRGIESVAARWTDFLVTMNNEDFEAAAGFGSLPKERVRFMSGIGVDLDRYRPGAVDAARVEDLRRELKIGPDEVAFTMIAEFIRRKRHEDAIRGLAKMRNRNAHLLLAGVGPLHEAMQALAVSLGVGDRVHFLGFRDDVPVLIRASRAVLLVSSQEGLPRSVMESFCLGVPVIGSKVRGTEDLLAPEQGIAVELGDVDGIAGALDWATENPQQCEEMGRRGRAAMASYDVRRIIEAHESLYEEALNSPPWRNTAR